MTSPRSSLATLMLAASVISLTQAQVNPPQPPLPKDAHPMYKSLKMTPLTVDGKGPFKVGDPLKFSFDLQNAGAMEIVFPPVGLGNQTIPSPGGWQAWIERLGRDPRIPAISQTTAKRGNQYAAGGAVISGTDRLKPTEKIALTTFPLNTANYPAGNYRYTVEIKDEKERIIYRQSMDLELKAAK